MGIFGPSDPLYNHTKAPSALCGTPHLMRACFTAVNLCAKTPLAQTGPNTHPPSARRIAHIPKRAF